MSEEFSILPNNTFNFKNPVLIEGLPGIGNIARISVDFLATKLKAKKVCDIYSAIFPALCIIDDKSRVDLPKAELLVYNHKGRDIIFLIGDTQPSDNKSYILCSKVFDIVKPAEVITIGGIPNQEKLDAQNVHAACTGENVKKRIKKLDLMLDGNETVSLIVGAAGVFLGMAKIKGIDGFALLVETLSNSSHFGIRGAKEILTLLIKYLDLNVDLSELDNEIKNYEKEIKRQGKNDEQLKEYLAKIGMENESRYIG